MRAFLSCLRLLSRDRKGVTAMEYGVIAAAIVVTGLTVLPTIGGSLNTTFGKISTSLGG